MQNVSILMCQVISPAAIKLILPISLDLLVKKIEVFLNKKIFRNSEVWFCSSLENTS